MDRIEVIKWIIVSAYLVSLCFITQINSALIYLIHNYNLLGWLLLISKAILSAYLPFVAATQIIDIISKKFKQVPIHIDYLLYILLGGILLAYTFATNSPSYNGFMWGLFYALSFSIGFLLRAGNMRKAFTLDLDYLNNYLTIKRVILISTIALPLIVAISVSRMDHLEPLMNFMNFPFKLMIQFFVTLILTIEIVMLFVIYTDKDFRYYNSSGYLQSVIRNRILDETKLTRNLIRSIESYSRYPERTLGLRITKLEKLSSIISLYPVQTKVNLIGHLYESLTLAKLTFLKNIHILMPTSEMARGTTFLAKKRNYDGLKDLVQFTIPITAVIISVLDLLKG